MYKENELYKYSKEELLDLYMPILNNINNSFTKENVEDIALTEAEYAQPIIKTNYSLHKVKYRLDKERLYIANMEQIYPEDRGMNYAIRLGYEIADNIVNETKRRDNE